MSNEIIIAIVSALGGVLITLISTYFNNKAKRFELEYNYRKKLEEGYLLNAQKHIEDVYIPLYSKLIICRNNWTKLKNSGDCQNLKNEISELENFKKDLEEKGLTAFLTPEIENSFSHILDFLYKSQDASKARYGLICQYNLLGQEKIVYKSVPEMINSKTVNYYRRLIIILDFFKYNFWMSVTGIIDYDFKVVLDSAPLDSNDFDDQFLKFLTGTNDKIKDITLGII